MNWWQAKANKLNKAQLIEVLLDIPKSDIPSHWTGVTPTTNAGRRELITAAQRQRFSRIRRDRMRPAPFPGIPATEVNAWLRSMPALAVV